MTTVEEDTVIAIRAHIATLPPEEQKATNALALAFRNMYNSSEYASLAFVLVGAEISAS